MAPEEGVSRVTAPIVLLVEAAVSILLAVYLLWNYGDIRRQNPLVSATTLLVWFLSFFIIFVLPVDVSSAFYHLCLESKNITSLLNITIVENCDCSGYVCTDPFPDCLSNNTEECQQCFQPYSFVCSKSLQILWYIIYWLFFVLSWVVIPLGQSYVLASYFSVWKRLLRTLVENVVIYLSLFLIFVVLFVYLVIIKKVVALQEAPWLIATASNTWGLVILTLLLGYGLVEVPRSVWNASRKSHTLSHSYFKAAKLSTDMSEADEKLSEAIERVNKVTQSLHYNDPLRKYIDIIIKKFPAEVQAEFNKGHDDYEDYKGRSGEDSLSKSSLEKLLKQSMKAIRLSRSTHIQWEILTDRCLDMEDVEQNRHSSTRFFRSSLRSSPTTFLQRTLPYFEWYWKVWIRSWMYRVIAVCLAVLSVTVVWSEVTFSIDLPGKDTTLSFFGFLVYAGHKFGNYITVEILSVCVVAYLSLCAYFTAFRIRIFNLYNLAPRHSTDEYSLLFSAVLLSRLALPICLNYLYVIQVVRLVHHVEDQVPQTAFAYATGNTSLIPWLSNYFYIYYPALILIVCIATLFSCGSRLASVFGYQKFIGEDDFSADYIDEGKVLMKRERRLRERSLREEGTSRRKRLNSFEQLKLSRAVRYSHQKRERLTPVSEESRLKKFTSQMKGLATKGKEKITAKYSKRDDAIELLNHSSTTTTSSSLDEMSISGRSLRNYQPRRGDPPPSDIFNDI